jgi:UDP-glucose 4-epimerase
LRVLVTGGAGYIGSHTIVELLLAGHQVLAVDNLCNSHVVALEPVRFITKCDFDLIDVDIRNKVAMTRAFTSFKPDAVVHFSGFKAAGESIETPLKYYNNNVYGTICLLEVMAQSACHKIVFSSSATVYGVPDYLPYDELHPLRPINPYGRTKLMVEEMLRDWCQVDDRRSAIALRYFNPVGAHSSGLIGEHPKGTPNNLMPNLTQIAVGKKSILNIFGGDYDTSDGTAARDYIHIVDLARAHLAAIIFSDPSKSFEAINIGTGIPITVLELVKEFEKISKVRIPYKIVNRRAGDLPVFWANPTRARELLFWSAKLSLGEMCRDAWLWQNKNKMGFQSDFE